jgi:acyl carrier protein/GNAT superfamily N-acetyltransferase
MAAASELEKLARIGHYDLEPDAALDVLDRLMACPVTNASVVDIDWNTFAPAYGARRRRPVLAEIDTARYSPALGAETAPWVQQLLSVEPVQRQPLLVELLRRELTDVLGFDTPASMPSDRSFSEVGMDSLMMAELVGRLKKQTGKSCSALVFDRPTVTSLARTLVEELNLDGNGSPAAARAASEITGYVPDAEADIFTFHAAAWPRRNPALIPARWRWMHVDAAHRLGRAPRVWLYGDSGRIVGHMASIPVRLKLAGDEVSTGWLVDTMVLPSHRDQAIGSRLMLQAHQDQPISLSLGQTAEMREICFRLGWQQIAPLQIAQLLVRPDRVVAGKLPSPLAWSAGLALRASTTLRTAGRESPRLQANEVGRFGDCHDRLWAESARDLTCAVVRDASYLNWKYVDQPGQRLLRLELLDGGELQGVAVWLFREPDGHYRYRRAFLVDLVVPLSDQMRLHRVLRSACAVAAEHGPDALLCLHINARLTAALRACGFRLRRPERYLLADPGPLHDEPLATLLSEANWFVTQGDSDIDRPW